MGGRRSLRSGEFAVLCALTLWWGTTSAQIPPEPPAKVALISDWESGSPGHQMRLWAGLLFQLDPGWHIYWKNPGDSGEPPQINWSLPKGFHAGGTEWPTPERLGRGSVVDYGYEGQVLLMTGIEGPFGGDASKMKEIPLVADVKYVVCSEICIPAKVHLTLTVPVGASPPTAGKEWPDLFRTTRAQLPKPRNTVLLVSVESSVRYLRLSVGGIGTVRSAKFFPEEPRVVNNSAPQKFATTPNGFLLILKKSDLLSEEPKQLRPQELLGVVVVERGHAYEINAPILWH